MKIKIISILFTALLFSSCSKWIDPSINVDPNNPTDVAMAQLVAPIEVNLAYVLGGDLARIGCEWTQQIAGLQSQAGDIDIYNISESDIENAWQWNLYAPGMINTKILMEKAVEKKSPHYSGIAKVLMAYHLGLTTDLWGDVPYSDALNGSSGVTKAKYDTQQTIYTTIFTLLNGAITDLSSTSSAFAPGTDDVIYEGDLEKWLKTAYALTARYKLHLVKQNGAAAYTEALAAVAKSYTSNDDDFKVTFGSAYSNSNPIYQFTQERPGYISANSKYVSMLTATNDPRLSAYFDGNIGSGSGENNSKASGISEKYASSESPVYLMSYAEIKFIEAEAKLKTSDIPGAVKAYNDGLKASLQREGVYNATWFDSNQITSSTISLEKIINQKYLSSFLQIETWADWRRTGFPSLALAKGAVTSEIPRRFPYPQSERLYNGANMPSGLTITSRVWWDKN